MPRAVTRGRKPIEVTSKFSTPSGAGQAGPGNSCPEPSPRPNETALAGENLELSALSYAKRGWPVLPVHNPGSAGCSCGNPACKKVAKHPRTQNGLKNAATDPITIHDWWRRWPSANVGIRTGAPSRLVVLDLDPRHGGDVSLADLASKHGKLPFTPKAVTGGGGYHFFFCHPGVAIKSRASIAAGLDIRADGGFIVAPPSKHASGSTYQWATPPDAVPLAVLPEWLLQLANGDGGRNSRVAETPGASEPIIEGHRNATLARIAGSMRRAGLGQDAIASALLNHNRTACNPPLSEAEVRSIARSVGRYPAGTGDGKDMGLVKQLADAIISTEKFAQDHGGWLHRYVEGVYKPDGAAHVKRLVKALLEEWKDTNKWSSRRADEVVEYIRIDSPLLWERPPLDFLNLQNGLLDLSTAEMQPHSPEFLSPIQLPVKYDPALTCPAWEQFVSEVFPADAQDLAWQIPGWLMVPDCSIQKALLMVGEGGNGRSTYLAGVRSFLGRANVAAETLQNLEINRFAVAPLLGKLANICPDLSSARLAGSSVFKAITGGDLVRAEYKFKQPFAVTLYTRFVFSANHLPRSNDASQAFFRRWLIVPFFRTFISSEQISREILDSRLAAPAELSGLLNKALSGLRQIRKDGGFVDSESMGEAGREFRKLTDPVALWLDAMTVKSPRATVAKDALVTAYNATAQCEDRPPLTSKAIGSAIHRLMPGIKEGQRVISGRRQWVWLGLGLRHRED